MKSVPIRRIRIDQAGRLLLEPTRFDAIYAYVYREGNGLRWNPAENSFVAFEPTRWSHSELLGHIVRTLREGLSVRMVLMPETVWDNVSSEAEKLLRDVLTSAGAV